VRTVVHCAGAWDYTRVEDLTADVVERHFRVNLSSALLTLAGAAQRMTDNGRVVLLSSAAAYLAPAGQAPTWR
jgi:3-oxoacyl-[acyl-carrier protein] reductase